MKIIVLHWHGTCPHCRQLSCIYADFYRTENGTKLPSGFECGSCQAHITDEEFEKMQRIEMPCPKESKKSHMYRDSIKQWNVYVGCHFDCICCEKSFKAQMKRQKNRCILCYNYIPHFHPEILDISLPKTKGDEFIWPCSSGDISFAKPEWIEAILTRIRQLPDRTFFFQTKNPNCYYLYGFPNNVILDITLETNQDDGYWLISKAPLPSVRFKAFLEHPFRRKSITIEPLLEFDLDILVDWLKQLKPERVYIGYDSKNCYLPEPELAKTIILIEELKKFTKVKVKLLRKAWWEE